VEFGDVVRRRKMVRTFQDAPVVPEVVERILRAGQRAPSAGYTQGFAFLVFHGPEETGRFWEVSSAGGEAIWLAGVRPAPVVVVPLTSKRVYLERYAESDKGWTDLDEARWPAPYWYVDAAFASMLMLLAAVDEGLGALFFGLFPPAIAEFKAAFGVPQDWEPIGAIAMGHPAPVDPAPSSRNTRPRKPLNEIVHRGRWSG
jgi:nitroreductase